MKKNIAWSTRERERENKESPPNAFSLCRIKNGRDIFIYLLSAMFDAWIRYNEKF